MFMSEMIILGLTISCSAGYYGRGDKFVSHEGQMDKLDDWVLMTFIHSDAVLGICDEK
jgi:hypothetical protein